MENSSAQEPTTLISRTGFSYFPIAIAARLPFAMMIIGVLTLVVSARGSIELGGLNSAAVGLGVACVGPFIGASADRFGQRRTLLIVATVNSVMLGLLSWVAFSSAPLWLLFLMSFLTGATVPQISPMSRARLVGIISTELPVEKRPRTLSSVFAYESAADEMIFVFGPVIVGLLATLFGAWAPVAGAGVLTLLFVTAFALHPTGRTDKLAGGADEAPAPVRELALPGLVVVIVGALAVGMFFGSMLTALTSFMSDRGAEEQSGLIYGVMGVGSAIFAIGVAWMSPRFTLRARWLSFAALMTAGAIYLQTTSTLGELIVALALMGIGIGPLLVTLYSFASARTPRGRSATVMAMLGTGITVGQSFTAAVTGIIAENLGTSAALTMPLVSAAIALIAGLVNWGLTGKATSEGSAGAPGAAE